MPKVYTERFMVIYPEQSRRSMIEPLVVIYPEQSRRSRVEPSRIETATKTKK